MYLEGILNTYSSSREISIKLYIRSRWKRLLKPETISRGTRFEANELDKWYTEILSIFFGPFGALYLIQRGTWKVNWITMSVSAFSEGPVLPRTKSKAMFRWKTGLQFWSRAWHEKETYYGLEKKQLSSIVHISRNDRCGT